MQSGMRNEMDYQKKAAIEDAFNSMLRSDYIPLKDTGKLIRLADYYVDYLGFLREVVGESDSLIVGRRGTGKTTLLYRGLIETINSWKDDKSYVKNKTIAKKKTLGIYLDLSKCQSLEDTSADDYSEFEHVFACELLEAVKAELNRTWPSLKNTPNLVSKLFTSKEVAAKIETNTALEELARILSEGVLRVENKSGKQNKTKSSTHSNSQQRTLELTASSDPNAGVTTNQAANDSESNSTDSSSQLEYRLNISDILRSLSSIKEAASISHIVIFVDEFSSLNTDLQRRFSTLLRKILGNHAGVFIKLCAITDNYALGSSIILQRDLFELNLDLDSYVERNGSLGSAMKGLSRLTENLISERIYSYAPGTNCSSLFEDFEYSVEEISKAAMGVPRTVGIILKQALSRNLSENSNIIRKSDVDYGIKYASKAYLNQFMGACGIAIPNYYKDIWNSLLDKAILERSKSDSSSSHYMVLPRNEARLKYFNMFFISHLLTQGRTTKKDKASRSLYSFDYGICIENNMSWGTDKNVIRQQRFVYDSVLEPFDHYFESTKETHWNCPTCETTYKERDLSVAGMILEFCPKDRTNLVAVEIGSDVKGYTEEEIKIVGAIRSSSEEDEVLARHVADDVGCYVQKVSRFGAKLVREDVVKRKQEGGGKYIYFRNRHQ